MPFFLCRCCRIKYFEFKQQMFFMGIVKMNARKMLSVYFHSVLHTEKKMAKDEFVQSFSADIFSVNVAEHWC